MAANRCLERQALWSRECKGQMAEPASGLMEILGLM